MKYCNFASLNRIVNIIQTEPSNPIKQLNFYFHCLNDTLLFLSMKPESLLVVVFDLY